MVRLSVVVPFHNVEDYIEAALESVARQTFGDLEVVMVDDGSSDSSAVIAKGFCMRDPRFSLLTQDHCGPAVARNRAIVRATGEYLAFFDADDLLDPHAYEALVGSLEQTGSDLAAGGCMKFSAEGRIESWLHVEPFRQTARRTHVSRFPVLLQDRTTTNKVFRRAFWDRHGFEFPDRLYEDPPVAIRAHVLASAVDLIQDVVYYWRVRDAGEMSTTQRSHEVQNVQQRMASVRDVSGFLAEHSPELKPTFDESVLKGDLLVLTRALEFASDEDRALIVGLAAAYLASVDESVQRRVPVRSRLRAYLLRRQMLPEMLEVLRHERRNPPPDVTVTRSGGKPPRWYARYPNFGDSGHRVPDEIYDVTDEMNLQAGLDRVHWRGSRLRIEGHAYIRYLSSAAPAECRIRVLLRNSLTHRTARLPVRRVLRPDVTAASGQASICYDWSGFVAEVDSWRLATLPGVWRRSSWEVLIEVSGDGLCREGPVGKVRPGSAQWPAGRWVNGGVWLQPAPEHDARFFIRGQQVTAYVTVCEATADGLEIAGWTTAPLAAGATVVATPRKGGRAAVRTPVQPDLAPAAVPGGHGPAGRHPFRARLPVTDIVRVATSAGPIDRTIQVHDEFTWDLALSAGPKDAPARLAVDPAAATARLVCHGREVTAFATHFGSLSLLDRTPRAVVTELDWTGDRRLILRGNSIDPHARPATFALRHAASGQELTVPVWWDLDSFTCEFLPPAMPGPFGRLPMASGSWQVLARSGDTEISVAVARVLLRGLGGYHQVGLHEVEAQPYHTDALRLHVRFAEPDDERGKYAKRQLRARCYQPAAARPLREVAIFDSFSSRHYACNPRAIAAELRRRRPDLECVWVSGDGQFSVPEGMRVTPANSREHFELMARARYVVVNDELPRWYSGRDGQICLQTWHGTPLKRIGLDIERPQFPSALIYPEMLASAVAKWDVLLSPNPFSTKIFRRAFGFEGEILEGGYPRNDALHRPDSAARAAVVRQQLGIPAGKRVILYAPTWRDNTARPGEGYRFDLRLDADAMAEALGEDHVLLLRLHTNARHSRSAQLRSKFVVSATAYPDITDLMLASDVLITDYSSVMFDFAGTGRPILFFTYDLESYRDDLRGFYVDFEAEAPGPMLESTEDVIEALRDISGVERSARQAYAAFTAKYCTLDDGNASSRAVSRLLAE